MSRKGSTFALIAQGLLKCGCDPEPWLVNELIDASSPKVPRMDIGDLQTLAHVSGRLGGGSGDGQCSLLVLKLVLVFCSQLRLGQTAARVQVHPCQCQLCQRVSAVKRQARHTARGKSSWHWQPAG